jgi:hypothetical protein
MAGIKCIGVAEHRRDEKTARKKVAINFFHHFAGFRRCDVQGMRGGFF